MFPYSHLVWANRLWEPLGIEDLATFNLGAILPDVRYVDNLTWEQTHPPQEEFWALAQEDGVVPERDFALGYLLHLGMDQWEPWFLREARQRYPLGRIFPRKIFKLLLEAASLQAYPLQDIALSQEIPALALRLDIPTETIQKLRDAADRILLNPSLDEAIAFVQDTELSQKPIIRMLMWTALAIMRTPLRHLLLRPAVRVLREMEPELEVRFLDEMRPFLETGANGDPP
jgi:hypothetical protein